MKQGIVFGLLIILLTVLSAVRLPEKNVTGIVFDSSSNAPLIGANVVVKRTTLGTITDFDGKFNLIVPDNRNVLVISYVGYATREIKIGKKINLSIGLDASISLHEAITLEKENKIRFYQSTLPTQDAANIQGYTALGSPRNGIATEEYENWNTEDYDMINENRFLAARDNPLSTFSIDVDGASYSNIRRFLKNGNKPPVDAVRIEEMVNYFSYAYEQPEGKVPFSIFAEISESPWNADHKLVHIGMQGKEIPTENLPASNLVFLLDVSGSMNQPNKLPLVISSFKLLLDNLREQDRVAIVTYAGSSGLVLPSTSGAEKDKIVAALDMLKAGGSTAGAAGIKLAYQTARENFVEGGNNRVILATDGDFNIGVSSDAELVRIIEKERESGVFLTVLGFGIGNYKDNKMQKLADHGNGNHAYIDELNEAKKIFLNEFGGTLFTIAKDVKLQVEFNPAKVQAYRLIGYENRMLNKEDFNDDKKDAGEIGSGHTVTALYEVIPVGVKSEFTASVDDLKYQSTKVDRKASDLDEMLHIKIRYKAPDGDISKLIEQPLMDSETEIDKSSDNFRWAAAVAEFGMLLRDSEFKSDANYEEVERLALGAMGDDQYGYRKEFVSMVQNFKVVAGR